MTTTNETRTVDVTPTWRGVLPMLLLVVENGTGEGRRVAIEELERMADTADAHVASVKKQIDENEKGKDWLDPTS